MQHALYDTLIPFYRLLDPLEDHRDEGVEFAAMLKGAVPAPQSLLELGSGAGNGAHYLKAHFSECTLVDLSEAMLNLSKEINPDCEHIAGDMRSIRLGRSFDCVFVYDAICHMTSREDLSAAIATAFAHTRPGGAALFAPDTVTEDFEQGHEVHTGAEGNRSLRCLSWSWDPNPEDATYICDYAFLLKEDNEVRAVHDRHLMGLFPTDTWLELLREAGFEVEIRHRELPEQCSGYTDKVFVAQRPQSPRS